jgi:CzcA family heavy metal efflux pump
MREKGFFNALIYSSLRKRRLVLVIAVAFLLLGAVLLERINIDIFPQLNKPTVTVLVEAHGRAAEEVEQQITMPLESLLQGVHGLEEIRSKSQKGLATVSLYFPWGSNPFLNRQQVSEKLATAINFMPEHVDLMLAPISSIMGELMHVGISGGQPGQEKFIHDITEYKLRRRLQAIPGVSAVTMHGALVPEFQIILDPEKLQQFDISISQIEDHLEAIGLSTSGGFFERDGKEFVIRNSGNITSVKDLNEVFIGDQYGIPLKVKNIGYAREHFKPRIGDAGVNGNNGIILSIQKQPLVSTIELTEKIKSVCEEFQVKFPGIKVHLNLFQQARFVNRSIEHVLKALQEGALIILIVIAIFLWDLRSTLVTVCCLPISLFIAVIILELLGFTINTMTLAGLTIAIGEIVDDSIVDVENIHRKLVNANTKLGFTQKLNLIYHASSEIRNSIVLATFIVVIVFAPVLLLSGLAGKLFIPIASAYVIALVSSLFVALTLTPVLSFYLMRKANYTAGSPISYFLKKMHGKLLQRVFKFSALPIVLPAALLIMIFLLILGSRVEFMPSFNEESYTVEILTKPGTGLEKSKSIAQTVEASLASIDGIISVARRTGRAENDEHSSSSNYSEIDMVLKSGTNRKQIYEKIKATLSGYDDLYYYNIGQPISHRIDHMVTGVRTDAAYIVFGDDLRKLVFIGYAASEKLKSVTGIQSPFSPGLSMVPELKINPYPELLASALIPTGEFLHSMETALNGRVLGVVYDEEKRYEIRIRLPEEWRANTEKLKKLGLGYRPSGSKILLSQVADVYESKGPASIERLNGSRYMTVQFNLEEDPERALEDADKIMSDLLNSYPEFRVKKVGRYFEEKDSFKKISLFLIGAFGLLLLVLYFIFKSGFTMLQIIITIPLSFFGGLAALKLVNIPLSIASLVGFIALIGISSRNTVLLLSSFWRVIAKKTDIDAVDIINVAGDRLIPVLMTALSTSLALLPILIRGSDSPGQEILFPIAVVIVGGLLTSTFLEIFVTPACFYYLAKNFYRGTDDG